MVSLKMSNIRKETKIFSIALNLHDHNTYDGVWHNQRERYTRHKHNFLYKNGKIDTDDYTLVKEFDIELLIESGVYRGGSTSIWINTLPDINKPIDKMLKTELINYAIKRNFIKNISRGRKMSKKKLLEFIKEKL